MKLIKSYKFDSFNAALEKKKDIRVKQKDRERKRIKGRN